MVITVLRQQLITVVSGVSRLNPATGIRQQRIQTDAHEQRQRAVAGREQWQREQWPLDRETLLGIVGIKCIIMFVATENHLTLILSLDRKCTKIITEQNVVLQSTYLHGQNECVVFYLSVFLTGALLKTQKIFWGASRCALRRLARLRGLAVAACGGHACGAGPNFGPVGPPLRMLRSGRSGPLWVPLCSGRSGRGLWACSVGRADRPGLLPSIGTLQAVV